MPKTRFSLLVGFWAIAGFVLILSQYLRWKMQSVGVLNHGLAFSLDLPTPLIFAVMILFLLAMFWLFYARWQASLFWSIAFGLIIGGGASNLIDRLLLSGGVVDYWRLGNLSMINFADIAITCGIVLAIIALSQPSWNPK